MGANPVDRGKPGSKLQLICDGSGLPLTAVVTAANVNDITHVPGRHGRCAADPHAGGPAADQAGQARRR
jgi:hypothetical protein